MFVFHRIILQKYVKKNIFLQLDKKNSILQHFLNWGIMDKSGSYPTFIIN